MLLNFHGKPVSKLLADTTFFRGNNIDSIRTAFSWNADLYFPSTIILELSEFKGIDTNGLPKINSKWVFIHQELIRAENKQQSTVIFPSSQDLINTSRLLTQIELLRKEKNTFQMVGHSNNQMRQERYLAVCQEKNHQERCYDLIF